MPLQRWPSGKADSIRETRRLLLITAHKRQLTSFIWELNHQDLTSLFFYCKEADELH